MPAERACRIVRQMDKDLREKDAAIRDLKELLENARVERINFEGVLQRETQENLKRKRENEESETQINRLCALLSQTRKRVKQLEEAVEETGVVIQMGHPE